MHVSIHVCDLYPVYMLVTCMHVLNIVCVCTLDDHSRVKLEEEHNVNGSDYINASFIVSSDIPPAQGICVGRPFLHCNEVTGGLPRVNP